MARTKAGSSPSSAEIRKLIHDPRPNSDSAALLNDIIDIWGGTKQFAKDLVAEFKLAPEGGMTRQRILEMIQRLIITNTQQELSRPKRAEDLDDEDLDRVIQNALVKVNGNGGPSTQG